MALISVNRLEVGKVGVTPGIVLIYCTDSLAVVTAAGYLNSQNLNGTVVSATDMIAIVYSGGKNWFSASVNAATGVITLSASESSIALPTIANHLAVYLDVNGSLGEDAATAINGGNIQAGLSGTAGTLSSFPATAANGKFVFAAVGNAGNFIATVSPISTLGQASVYTLPDPANALARILVAATATPFVSGNLPKASGTGGLMVDSGIAAANLQTSSLSSPDAISDLIWYDVTATAAALATAGKVNIQVSSAAKQYKVRDVKVNYAAAGLSGGGGDRLLAISDGTTVYNNAGITAALLGTPINTNWGGTGNPVAGTVAQNTSTAAGANLYLQYAGGTTDYTTGQIVVSVLVQRVA